ncbi:nuclear transport factor 2 family protein [Marinifilum sp. D714]|uniref:nuclear transport factor 2 family protein n=1 Tax=Marinifilum sp. D714 TaxID=2937523 RepID=UPI0027BE77A3|nr:nuclear transport factor 2 family protein [Marinifilum sp. D714]MDQ2179189.1 nuclear transport factor 2 family protein [Marinifilum sp. D714]
MKKILFLLVAVMLSSGLFSQDLKKEKEAIKNVIQTAYVDGLQNEGDLDKIDSGIHPDFRLIGIGKENSMWSLPIDKWKEKTKKKKADGKFPRTGDKKVSVKFENIDITGNAAVAKIQFFVGTKLTYVDYISLYKFPNGWKMVNKIYYKIPEKE